MSVIPLVRVSESLAGTVAIDAATPIIAEDPTLVEIAERFAADLEFDTGLRLRVVTADDGLAADGSAAQGAAAQGAAIRIDLGYAGLNRVPLAAGLRADGRTGAPADERHGIAIDHGGVRIWGLSPEAVHRGLTSVRQWIGAAEHHGVAELDARLVIDGPRYAWRGLSLDVVRTFFETETLRRVIDMCSLYKLNVLHLHLTDDQGWRLEVPEWPRLTEVGARGAAAGRPGGHYSPDEIEALVRYAADRFVTIVPEIDMPGHTAAVFAAYPELRPDESPVADAGMPLATLDPDREATWRFVGDVLDAVVAQFPHSAYVHLGADEAFGMADDAHARFVDRAIAEVRRRGRRAVGWQESARAAIGPDEVVQYWMEPNEIAGATMSDALAEMVPAEILPLILEHLAKASGDVPAALEKGARVLVSPTSRLYFDRPHAAASVDDHQEERRARVGLPVYPATTLRDGIDWDPIDETPGVDDDAQLAGVEAAIWCETVEDRDDLEFLLLPRLAGAAEKSWARRDATVWDDYAARLARQSRAWDQRGWNWFKSGEIAWPLGAVGAVSDRSVSALGQG